MKWLNRLSSLCLINTLPKAKVHEHIKLRLKSWPPNDDEVYPYSRLLLHKRAIYETHLF